jgi:hypothetical protein
MTKSMCLRLLNMSVQEILKDAPVENFDYNKDEVVASRKLSEHKNNFAWETSLLHEALLKNEFID